jgi:periplasmic divalent cation tolerance protein
MTDKIVVLTTCDSEQHAEKLARHLVDQRVAACVNVLPKACSIYRWNEKVEEASEWMLIIKSRRDLFAALRSEIQKLHTYEVPELIALPVVDGSEPYFAWFDAQLTTKAE